MIIASIPALVAIVGVLAYALSKNAEVKEIGRISFAFGLLVVLMVLAHANAVHL